MGQKDKGIEPEFRDPQPVPEQPQPDREGDGQDTWIGPTDSPEDGGQEPQPATR